MVLIKFLNASSNLSYFKKSIFSEKKLGENIEYNIAVIYQKSEALSPSVCSIKYTLIPFFVNKENGEKFFAIHQEEYLLEDKIDKNSLEYPLLELKINMQEDTNCSKIYTSLLKIKETKTLGKLRIIRLLAKNKLVKKEFLKNGKFNANKQRISFGTVIEKSFLDVIKEHRIYFLKDNNNTIDILVKDLCYGNQKTDFCIGNDLVLKLKSGDLQKKSSSRLVETHKVKVKIENIERFKFIDGRYYLYFYDSKKACNKDKEYQSKVNIKESFVTDIKSKIVDSQYKWLKGREFNNCIQGSIYNSQLKFGI